MILLNVLIALATFSTTLTATLLAIYQIEKRRRKTYGVKDSDIPVLESQDRADAIVKNATEKARAALLAAEQEGAGLVEKYKLAQSQIEGKYSQQTDEIIKENKNRLAEKSQEVERSYAASLKALENSSREQILQKEKEIQGRINQYFTTVENSLKAYTEDLKKRTQEVQMPFDQIKAELTQKITDTEKLYSDHIKSLEEKVDVSLTKNQNALDETRKMLEAKDIEAEKAYNDYLINLKTKVEQIFTQNQKDMEEMQAGLGAKISQTEDSYAKFLKSLEDNMILDFNKKQQALDVKVSDFFGQTQEMLGKFLKELENRTQTQVEEEIGNARKLIDEYKQQRLKIVDENLIAILEKTLNITLGKKLTLSDQTQLVYEALEEAKKENFFA